MKFSSQAVTAYEKSQEQSDSSQTKQWLNPNEIEEGQEVEFIFLEEDPFEFWEVWGDNVDPNEKSKPFRFLMGDNEGPTDEDILKEMGGLYRRQTSKYANKRRNIKVGDPRPADSCMAWPVWNCDDKCIQILKVSQKSLQGQIIKTSMLKKYRNKMECFNHTIHKGTPGGIVTYTFTSFERDDDFDEDKLAKTWEAQECKMELLLDNGEPLNPGGSN